MEISKIDYFIKKRNSLIKFPLMQEIYDSFIEFPLVLKFKIEIPLKSSL